MLNGLRLWPQGFHQRNEFRIEAENARRRVIQNVVSSSGLRRMFMGSRMAPICGTPK